MILKACYSPLKLHAMKVDKAIQKGHETVRAIKKVFNSSTKNSLNIFSFALPHSISHEAASEEHKKYLSIA